MLKSAVNGTGSVFLVSGPTGIGKTALLARFGSIATPLGDVTELRFGAAGRAWRPLVERARASNGSLLRDVVAHFETATSQRMQVLLVDDVHLAESSDLDVIDALVDVARSSRLAISLSFTNAARELPPPHLAERVARWR